MKGVGAGNLHISHVEGPVRDVLLESIKVRFFLPSVRMLNASGPALGDDHCSLRVNCHHLAENLSSDFTHSRGAFLFDLAGLTTLLQGLFHLVQRCLFDICIDDVCNELASFIQDIPQTPLAHTVMNETKFKRITGNLQSIRETFRHRNSDETKV
jgi:hypothetical protein